jgi:membrane protease YdiL (CAAX protease family)
MAIVLLAAHVAAPRSGLIEDQGIMATHGIARWVGTVLSLVMLTPVLEEIEFRGLLFGTLRSRIGWVPAAIASSILFGLMHPYGSVGKVIAAVHGVIFCCVYERTGSVWAPIITHVVVNLSATATFAFLAWEHSFS